MKLRLVSIAILLVVCSTLFPPAVKALTCVPVSCNGQPAGQVCGNTLEEIRARAILTCSMQ